MLNIYIISKVLKCSDLFNWFTFIKMLSLIGDSKNELDAEYKQTRNVCSLKYTHSKIVSHCCINVILDFVAP